MSTTRKTRDSNENYQAGYSINSYPVKLTSTQKTIPKWRMCVEGIPNATEDHAYSCYISATFQLLVSNTSFVREVLDFLVSHQVILTKKIRIPSNNTDTSFSEEMNHMKEHPTLALFLLMMKQCRQF